MDRRRIVPLALLVVAALIAARIVRRDEEMREPAVSMSAALESRTDADTDAPREPAARRAATPATEPTASGSAEASAARALPVRSSAGLALASFEIESDADAWRRVDLVDGAIDRERVRAPARVRAPGHVSSLARPEADEIVLEPDALLLIQGVGLRDCLGEVGPSAKYGAAEHRAAIERTTTSAERPARLDFARAASPDPASTRALVIDVGGERVRARRGRPLRARRGARVLRRAGVERGRARRGAPVRRMDLARHPAESANVRSGSRRHATYARLHGTARRRGTVLVDVERARRARRGTEPRRARLRDARARRPVSGHGAVRAATATSISATTGR